MNELSTAISEELLRYQAQRLQDLIAEMLKCCEDRKLYESGRLGLPYSDLKILMLTSVDEETKIDFKSLAGDPDWLPVDDYVSKPVELGEFAAKVEALIGS